MTSKEKEFVNNLAKEVLKLKHDKIDDYLALDSQITRLYIIYVIQALAILLLAFK